jgi:hypothetical protein
MKLLPISDLPLKADFIMQTYLQLAISDDKQPISHYP